MTALMQQQLQFPAIGTQLVYVCDLFVKFAKIFS